MFGQVALTQALLPALLAARGRIVNISSISGLFAIPVTGPYAASKYAIEAISDVLRREIGPHGVHVACVEPGVISTRVWGKSRAQGDQLVAGMPADAYKRYETAHQRAAPRSGESGTRRPAAGGGGRSGRPRR